MRFIFTLAFDMNHHASKTLIDARISMSNSIVYFDACVSIRDNFDLD
jgi:hypothetical protein